MYFFMWKVIISLQIVKSPGKELPRFPTCSPLCALYSVSGGSLRQIGVILFCYSRNNSKVLICIIDWYYIILVFSGAFLIPYFLCLVVGGVPLLILELGIGQMVSQGGISCWGLCPIFKGIYWKLKLLQACADDITGQLSDYCTKIVKISQF